IEVVPGVEISAAFREKDIHILGLLVNPHSQELVMALEQARQERDNRNERMAAALEQAGIRLDIAAIQASNPGAVITRAHFAGYLVETKQAKDYKTAFDLYLGDETPYYIPRKFIEP
ncbi:MAG: PHP domain-containing protein, partial [Lachnospiraceae bacterium]|nr:PHP domain-containing protein [Lachnospiraceae bacterium]